MLALGVEPATDSSKTGSRWELNPRPIVLRLGFEPRPFYNRQETARSLEDLNPTTN
jgi:hypothetical protein